MRKTNNKSVKRTVLITQAHDEFLRENDRINLSGLVREKIDEVMAEGD
jgi:hypothetical protein